MSDLVHVAEDDPSICIVVSPMVKSLATVQVLALAAVVAVAALPPVAVVPATPSSIEASNTAGLMLKGLVPVPVGVNTTLQKYVPDGMLVRVCILLTFKL